MAIRLGFYPSDTHLIQVFLFTGALFTRDVSIYKYRYLYFTVNELQIFLIKIQISV